MKDTIKDSRILKTVNPDVLQAHLQATGWHETGRIYNDAGAIWRLRKDDENEYEILLPLQHNLEDVLYCRVDLFVWRKIRAN